MTSFSTQSSGGPDELELIRRDRGEGWQWHRIQTDPCPQCGYHPAAQPPNCLGEVAVELAAAWREFLLQADDESLRTTPEPGVFSPIQYGAHVRNMVGVAGDRMLLGIEQDSPVVPMHNPPQDEWASYNSLGREELAAQLEAQAQRLAKIVADMDPSAWSRTVINDRGVYGIYSFTLAGLACNAVHESYHHLLDAKGTLSVSGSS